jgi:hypothetical protein
MAKDFFSGRRAAAMENPVTCPRDVGIADLSIKQWFDYFYNSVTLQS